MSNSNVVGQIALELGINSAEFKKQLRSLGKTVKTETVSMTKMFSSVGTVIAGALAVGKIINFSKACIELGSDLAEVQNVVDVTFGSMSEQVNDFAKNAMESYGLSEKVAKQYMGTFGAMSKAFGYTTEAAYEQAAALTGLAGDVASFYNLTTDEAYTKLKSVFTGETESLKDLGVVMTQTALDEYALQKGMGKTTSEMSEQEKVALRLAFVQDRLATASGDFARTSEGWANQTRVLTLKFESLKATLGQGFINVLSPLLPLINELVDGLSRLADAFYDITVTMFGDAAGGSSAALSAAATSTGEIASGMSDGVKSAKAMKKILAGFDQLNLLSSSSGEDSSGGDGAGGSSGGLSGILGTGAKTPGYDTSPLKETLTEITALVGTATLAIGALFAFTGANIPLGIGLMLVGAGSLAAAVAMNWNAVETQVATTLDLITATVSAATLAVGAVLCFSGSHIPLGIALMATGAMGLAAVAAMNWDSTTNAVKATITGIMTAVSAASLALGIILLWAGVSIPLGIALLAAGAVGLASSVGCNWGSMTDSVGSTVTTIAAIVGGALLGLGAVLAFSGLFVGLGIALMGAGAVSLASAIAPNWSGISDKTRNTISIISGIAGAAMLALGCILLFTGAGIPLGLGLIAAGGVSLAAAIAPNWNKITDTIKNICTKIGGFFSNLWEGLKKGFKGAVNGIIGYANTWIKGLNALLIPVRALIVAIAQAFGKDITLGDVKIPSIPKLASGGYVAANTPQLAIIGDNKREGEIVAPESKIAEAVATGVAAAMRQFIGLTNNGGSSKQATPIVIKIGEDDFWSGFIDYHNSVVKRTGDSPLLI